MVQNCVHQLSPVSSTYIAYLAGGSGQDETNVAADWLQVDSRTQIAAVV